MIEKNHQRPYYAEDTSTHPPMTQKNHAGEKHESRRQISMQMHAFWAAELGNPKNKYIFMYIYLYIFLCFLSPLRIRRASLGQYEHCRLFLLRQTAADGDSRFYKD